MLKRSEAQIASDYKEFRGRCKELVDKAVKEDPTLTPVRGHYFCTLWCTEEPHWWTIRQDGSIFDPTARQFPSNGAGVYVPFNGLVACSNCGKEIREEDGSYDSNYVFCSHLCHGRFVGVY